MFACTTLGLPAFKNELFLVEFSAIEIVKELSAFTTPL